MEYCHAEINGNGYSFQQTSGLSPFWNGLIRKRNLHKAKTDCCESQKDWNAKQLQPVPRSLPFEAPFLVPAKASELLLRFLFISFAKASELLLHFLFIFG